MTLLRFTTSLPPPPPPPNDQPSLLQPPPNLTSPDPFPTQSIVCYDSRYALHAPSYASCERIIKDYIATGQRPFITLSFARDPDPRRQSRVPKRWLEPRNMCDVGIDVPYAVEEEASLTEIQAAARSIMMKCVLGGEHLGGFTFIGRRGGLLVKIIGDDD
ncbi:MAG: hypothetical protein Q9166_004836 [cf. Caloplaca sp. 2 TL-2023]